MKQTCLHQLTGELVIATDKTTTNQLVRSKPIRARVTQTAASIEPNHTTQPHTLFFDDKRSPKANHLSCSPVRG